MSTLTTNNSLTQSNSGNDPTSSRLQQKSVNFSPEFSDRASHNKKRGEKKMGNIKTQRKSRIAKESKETSPGKIAFGIFFTCIFFFYITKEKRKITLNCHFP